MTEEELIKKLNDINTPPDIYSLDDSPLPGRLIRQKNYARWIVFYRDERGGISYERTFTSEAEANQYVYDILSRDADMYKAAKAKARSRIFESSNGNKKYTLEVNYYSKSGVVLHTYVNNEHLSEELLAETYEKAITVAYKKYGLNPYGWKEKY